MSAAQAEVIFGQLDQEGKLCFHVTIKRWYALLRLAQPTCLFFWFHSNSLLKNFCSVELSIYRLRPKYSTELDTPAQDTPFMHIYQASHTDGFRSLYLESVFSMPGLESLIQFLPFQVNPSHHYYLFVKGIL